MKTTGYRSLILGPDDFAVVLTGSGVEFYPSTLELTEDGILQMMQRAALVRMLRDDDPKLTELLNEKVQQYRAGGGGSVPEEI